MRVARQHAFGRPRGARGVDDRLGVPRLYRAVDQRTVRRRRIQGAFRQQGQAVDRHVRLAEHDRFLELGELGRLQPGQQVGMHDDEFGVRIVEHVVQQVPAIGEIDGDVDRTQPIDREPSHQAGRAVRQPHDDAVTLADTHGGEPGGSVAGLPGQLAERERRAIPEYGEGGRPAFPRSSVRAGCGRRIHRGPEWSDLWARPVVPPFRPPCLISLPLVLRLSALQAATVSRHILVSGTGLRCAGCGRARGHAAAGALSRLAGSHRGP